MVLLTPQQWKLSSIFQIFQDSWFGVFMSVYILENNEITTTEIILMIKNPREDIKGLFYCSQNHF